MNGNSPHQISREEVLIDFATAEEGTTAEVLETFVKRFPDYEAELRSLFESITAEEATPWQTEVEESLSSNFLETRVRQKQQQLGFQPTTVRASPFEGSSPQELRRLTRELNVTPLFMAKLKDRTIEGTSIPSGFVVWLSSHLGETVDTLRDFFSGETRMAKGLAFKSQNKPQVASKQSFWEALETSGLSEEQKQMLRDVCADKG